MNTPTFHPFLRLPVELQNLIWSATLPVARLINFVLYGPATHYPQPPYSYNIHALSKYRKKGSRPTTDPKILQICPQSRGFALQRYHLRKHYEARTSNFVNFQRDTCVLQYQELIHESIALGNLHREQEADWTPDYEDFCPGYFNPSKTDLEQIGHWLLNINCRNYKLSQEPYWRWFEQWMQYILPLFVGLKSFTIDVFVSKSEGVGVDMLAIEQLSIQKCLQVYRLEPKRREWLESILVVHEVAES